MNEQIKLPAQEWLGYDPEKGDLHGYTFEQMREFAELIVGECMQRLKTTGGEESFYSNKVMNYLDCIEDLKLHFGVEE